MKDLWRCFDWLGRWVHAACSAWSLAQELVAIGGHRIAGFEKEAAECSMQEMTVDLGCNL